MSDEIKVQPHDVEAEEGLLASCLLDLAGSGRDLLIQLGSMGCRPEWFFKTSHQTIFKALQTLEKQEEPIDEILLAAHLKTTGELDDVGGIAAIYIMQNRIETPAHAIYWARIVKDKFLLRRLVRVGREAIEAAYNQYDDVPSLIASTEAELRELSEGATSQSTLRRADAIVEENKATLLDKMNNPDRKADAVATHLDELNKVLPGGGLEEGTLVVIAARPSVGKTSLGMNFAEYAAVELGGEVLVFSLEMRDTSLIDRVCASNAKISAKKVKDATLDSKEQVALAAAYKRVGASGITIDTDRTVTSADIRARSIRVRNELARKGKKLDLIMIDYLQLLKAVDSRLPREQQIAEAARTMKMLSGEVNCPVLLLSQINRASEKENREPRISDLRESGSIEQDADTIILLHRMPPEGCAPDPEKETVKVILAKSREGPICEIMTTFRKIYTKFENAKS